MAAATTARADIPAALDRVPAGVMAVIAVPSLERMDRNVSSLITATGMPQISTPTQMMRMAGFGEGVDMTRSAAIMLMAGHMDAAVPPAVLLLPVSDYGAMLGAFGAQAGAGVTSFNAAGEQMHAKRIDGGYAAVSPMRELLDGFDGAEGNLAAHAIRIGASGAEVASTSDIVLIADAESLAAIMAAQPGMMGMMGPLAGLGGGAGDIEGMLQGVLSEASAIVMGTRASARGMHVDVAAQFKRDSSRFEAFSARGDTGRLLRNLPGDPFLVAFAIDTSDPRIKTMLAGGEGGGQMAGAAMTTMFDKADGQAGAIYPNPAGLLGGIFARGVYYYPSKDPAALMVAYRQIIEEMDGTVADQLQTTTSYREGAAEVEGTKLDAYSMRIAAVPGVGMPSPMAMLYGPAQGPNGHMARAEHGIYATTSPDTALMGRALRSSRGGSLGEAAMVNQVSEMLPKNRIAEAYIGVKPIIDQAMPFLAMMGQQVNVQVPQDLPPVGMSAVSEGGGVRFTAFVPAPVIKTSVEFAQNLGGMMGGMGQPRQNRGGPAF
ncbi:MAG: hypothetical protein EA379_07770 [Phycisphaerales bacterium]|nr:MAG: hypothetical protein EA379_07770 [Phycisphaerales bacterium]